MLSRQSRFPVLRERQRQLCHASLAGLTQEVCLKGLHQMKGDNLMIRKGSGHVSPVGNTTPLIHRLLRIQNSWLVSLDEILLRAGLLPAGTPSVSKGLWD